MYNLCNQSHCVAGFNSACQHVSRGFFPEFYFYIYIGSPLQGWGECNGRLWLPGCWIKNLKCFCSPCRDKQDWGEFRWPQRVLTRALSQLLNQSGRLRMGIWRGILNKEEGNSREDREHEDKGGTVLFFSESTETCFLHVAGGCRPTIKNANKSLKAAWLECTHSINAQWHKQQFPWFLLLIMMSFHHNGGKKGWVPFKRCPSDQWPTKYWVSRLGCKLLIMYLRGNQLFM